MVAGFRDEGNDSFIDECGGLSLIEHCCERLVEIRGNLLLAFLEELHGYAVMTRSFALREGSDGFDHLFHGKAADQTLVSVGGDPAGDALPA